MNDRERTLSYLGLALRAGKLASGDEGVMKAVRSRTACIVFVASDASDNARKKYRDKCEYYGVPISDVFDRRELGQSVGKAERVVVAVTDKGLSELVRKSLAKHAEVGFH
ncbi:L7Ae/L30e/S12e/Gadd45 family ribosomal protein [Paenibacillus sp.]|uniref:L7Ae/L30e/S12e/Gadd45 family ribosomal protein n=1 Tax=Paenibacillus sp. TaxID=58172 RepID=UPI002D4E0D9E|nr:ribosomal L7Ae/L30e/S12e/Gadd45 family protein [Paenibacillus sp.]HZG86752.1 ribosomal L7Ae/L30e/S12e/Gadd45 family protein [Paenibacillus sp.]